MIKDPISYYSYASHVEDSLLAMDKEEMFFAFNLRYYASRLLLNGLHDEAELETAIQKAITACLVAGLSLSLHFKNIFVCSSEIKKDWLVSGLALQLILLNAEVSNPLVAALQVGILSNNRYPSAKNT
ncbi:MAG TPA: hypothetical protein VK543_08595 [Puia sp.]|nr:hypothetical protein [Puia sp.]